MRTHKHYFQCIILTALLFAGFVAAGIAQDTTAIVDPEPKAPVILTTIPAGGEMNVDPGSDIEITFSSDMNEKSINGTTLLLHATSADTMYEKPGTVMLDDQIRDRSVIKETENSRQYTTGVVNGTISYSNKVAVFTPESELEEGTLYTFTVTNGVKSVDDVALANDQSWSFTTTGTSASTYFDKQNKSNSTEGINDTSTNKIRTIDLGKAGHFVILAKTSVNNNSASRITGHIGEGSVADSAQKVTDVVNSTRPQTPTGQVSSVLESNQSDTTFPEVTVAIEDMMSAYHDASMQNGDSTSHKNESFHNTELTPGVHEWSNALHIASDVTLSGSADDVWLIKVGDNLTIDENIVFTLTNGARAENIFWFVEGEVTIGKNAHFEGIILSQNEITLEKGAKLNGRMFSQTSITLDDNTITEPGTMGGQTTSSTNK